MIIPSNMDLPDATSFFWQQSRIKTFNDWPFKETDKCNAKCMAAAGFFVIGNKDEPDLVECFICGKQLDGWEPQDEPWNEHVKHQSNCSFVKLNKQNEMKWTVEELYDLYKKYKLREYDRELNQSINKLKNEAAELKSELPSMYKASLSIKYKKSTT